MDDTEDEARLVIVLTSDDFAEHPHIAKQLSHWGRELNQVHKKDVQDDLSGSIPDIEDYENFPEDDEETDEDSDSGD